MQTAQIRQSFKQLPIALVVNLVNGLILVALLWDVTSASRLLLWSTLLAAVTLGRHLMFRSFLAADRANRLDHAAWTRNFVAGACAAGIAWGTSGILLFHPSSFPHQAFLAFVLGGMVAGAVPLLSGIRRAYWCFTLPAVLPIGFQMLSVGDPVHAIMALMIAVFTVAMLASSMQVHRLYREAETLRRDLLTSIEAGETLEHMIRLDTLTQIPNRKLFEEQLRKEWRRARRENETLAVISADVDHFKAYNDLYGHPAGDRCLVEVAQTMQKALSRPADLVARIGGEEFAFLLPRTDLRGAVAVAEQVRHAILALKLPHAASPVAAQVTLSFGVAASDSASVASPTDLLGASDEALYEAKRCGRNRVAPTRAVVDPPT